jgi:predicted PurR-regulated permease PerM
MITEQVFNRKGIRFLISSAALVLIIWGITQAQSVISLILISGFLAIIGIPPFFWLMKKKIPSSIAVLIVIASMIIVFLIIDFMIGISVKSIIDSIPEYQVKLQSQLEQLKVLLTSFGIKFDDKMLQNYFKPEVISGLATSLLSGLISILSSTVLILLTVSFVLLEAKSFPHKLRTTLGDPKAVFPEFSIFVNDIKRYVLIQTVVSLATGIIAGIWLAIMGVDFAILFGLLTFLLNYIPNVGSIIAITPAVIVTFIQFGIERALIVFVGYLLITLVTGSIIVPRIMGQRLGISNLVVFLSLLFWGSLLGVIGMVLCVLLTMALKFTLERSENTRWIAALLGRESPKEPIPPVKRKEILTEY